MYLTDAIAALEAHIYYQLIHVEEDEAPFVDKDLAFFGSFFSFVTFDCLIVLKRGFASQRTIVHRCLQIHMLRVTKRDITRDR